MKDFFNLQSCVYKNIRVQYNASIYLILLN